MSSKQTKMLLTKQIYEESIEEVEKLDFSIKRGMEIFVSIFAFWQRGIFEKKIIFSNSLRLYWISMDLN